ncbi:CRISPR-associated endonuclease Cas9 [Peptococcaceae bacterium CEB3]|nr:CRISPR-associated endonuclease Cas9 [Peptococcaceae bacterium CEB3]
MFVLVLDTNKKPLSPCHPAIARKLLKQGRAAIFRRFPFMIILKEAKSDARPIGLRLKIDPGAKTTGFALLLENGNTGTVLWAAELNHRGFAIKKLLAKRRGLRRGCRNRKTRYRACRFLNRRRPKGWLPPSLQSRVENITTWVNRLCRLAPIGAISMELVRFDTQKLQNPEISGIEYQQGELFGYEIREYLLEKWGRKCAYCGKVDVPLEVEHIVPKSRGGTNRVSNLTLACHACNWKKDNRTAEEFGFPDIQKQAKKPLRDAAGVNVTRWQLYERLKATGLPVETGTGGQTKYNRAQRNLPKTHWLDATCVGKSTPGRIVIPARPILVIAAAGHGKRQRCITDKYGFPIKHAPKAKFFIGFQTGDIAKAMIPKGKYAGTHTGRIAIRFRPSFKLNGFDVHPKYLKIIQRADAYEYQLGAQVSSPRMNPGAPTCA